MNAITEKKAKEINRVLNKIDSDASAGFRRAYEEDREIEWLNQHWEQLEEFEYWNKNYSDVRELTMPKEEQLAKVYTANQKGFDSLSPAKLKTILASNDFTEQELRNYYKFREEQKKAVDQFNQARYAEKSDEYNKATRSKEDSYYNSPLANEYARKAYIEGDKDAALYNEIAGKAAGAADFAPLPLSLAGPIIRTGQKFAAKEPVLTGGTVADFAGAIIPDVAEKPAKMAFQYLKGSKLGKFLESKLGKQLEARINKADVHEAEIASKELDNLKNIDLDAMTNEELLKYYNSVQTPEIKAEIANQWKARAKLEGAKPFEEISDVANGPDLRLASAIAEKERNAAEQALIESERKAKYLADRKRPELELKSGQMKPDQPLFTNGDFNAYYKDVPIEAIAERIAVEPSKKADLLYNVLTLGGRKMARSTLGGRTGQWDMFDPEPKDTRDQNVEWVIKTYGKEWSPLVKPTNYDNDPLIKAAYDKWLQEAKVNNYPAWLKARGL
mgnify:CR=1 FL=1